MGQITTPSPVLLIVAAFSRHTQALDWGRARAEEAWGATALASPLFEFEETDYYEPTMGAGLNKTFWALEQPVEPGVLPGVKQTTNRWESELAATGDYAEARPLNLDPGYITLGKLVLASTKDHAHRLYLDQGVYAEVTLRYAARQWQHHEWTFPDYRRADYHQFFTECREYLRRRLRQGRAST